MPFDDAALRERELVILAHLRLTGVPREGLGCDVLRDHLVALRDAARAEQRTTDLAVLDWHIVIHRSNEARQRAIGNSALAAHNKWCATVLETAVAAIRRAR